VEANVAYDTQHKSVKSTVYRNPSSGGLSITECMLESPWGEEIRI
jgi:hypothetical protein